MKAYTYKFEIGDINLSVILNRLSFSDFREPDSQDAIQNALQTHEHSSYELMAITNGELIINNTNKNLLCKNQIIIVPPLLPHYCTFVNSVVAVLNFDIEKSNNNKTPLYDVLYNTIKNQIVTIPFNNATQLYINQLFDKNKSDLFEDAIQPLILLLFTEIFSSFTENTVRDEYHPTNTYMDMIGYYIAEHLNTAITLDTLAGELHICSKQISRIIKREFDCSLAELITRRRINSAAILLANTQLKLNVIATSVGYSSLTSFRDNFKKQYGVTPREYRKIKTERQEKVLNE